jgi:hypothetical protein
MIVMQRRTQYINYTCILVLLVLALAGCKKKEYELPVAKDGLQNDALKRTLGPNIVGNQINFVYAMAMKAGQGKLVSASVEASIAGAAGTYLDSNSYSTSGGGTDVPVKVGAYSTNSGNVTTVNFTRDTNAAALRYWYTIPEAARGQTVSFTFTAKSSNGETATYKLGPYTIAKMDMKRNMVVTDGDSMYLSISDMAVYRASEAAGKASTIDLVYLYRNLTTSAFNHSLVAPAADPVYLPGVTLPAGVSRNAKLRKVFSLQDYNLAQLQWQIFIDDLDFQQLNLSDGVNYAINLKGEAGVWVETADGKYRAYVYINSVTNGTKRATISIKRYAL